jgi:putative peptide zinc metalloprotease protein
VPDLFRRIGPVLRSLIPGQPTDPRVAGLKHAARLTLTGWVLAMVALLTFELALIILNVPGLARTFARSLDIQEHGLAEQFGRFDIGCPATADRAGLIGRRPVATCAVPRAAQTPA